MHNDVKGVMGSYQEGMTCDLLSGGGGGGGGRVPEGSRDAGWERDCLGRSKGREV